MPTKASRRQLEYPRIRRYSVIDNDYVIEKIVVTIRDVTKLRKMQTEAAVKEVELGIISELAVMDEQCFHEFIAQALGFVEDNK